MIMSLRVSILILIGAAGCSYAHIGSGEVGVVRTPDGVENKVYPPGDWRISVFDHATSYSIRSQEREERLDVQSSDGLGITLETSIRFHAIPTEVIALDQEFGQEYYPVLLGPTLRSQARRVVGRFKPEEIYSTQRELIEREIREGVETAIKGRHIELEAVLVRNVVLPAQIQAAITDKLATEQEALKMQFVLAQQQAEDQKKLMETKAEAERQTIQAESLAQAARVQAQGAADVARSAAQAAADAKRLDGQATADYQRLVLQNLTPAYLRLQEIDASRALAHSPNAKLVLMGGAGAHTLLDLRGVDGKFP
jgi:regulator of protease activity HflC (stomatin/prohibitin superfamily)